MEQDRALTEGLGKKVQVLSTASCKHWETVLSSLCAGKRRQQHSTILQASLRSNPPKRAQLQTPVSRCWARATTGEATAPTPRRGGVPAGYRAATPPVPTPGRQSSGKSPRRVHVSQASANDAPPSPARRPPPWMSHREPRAESIFASEERQGEATALCTSAQKQDPPLCAVSATGQVFHSVP